MSFEFSRRNTRHTALVMLLAWMMSLMAGFANACILEKDHHAALHVTLVAEHVQELAAVPSHAETSRDDAIALEACKAFCTAQETAALKYQGSHASLDACSVPFLIQSWITPVTASPEALRFASITADRSAPPARIRFVRLTL